MDPKALNDLRRRVLEKAPYTEAELAEAVRSLFGERARALEATPKKSTRKTLDLDDLLPK